MSFNATMRLVAQCQYDSIYIFKYSERPGTPAARLSDNVSEGMKTERFLALERLQKDIQRELYDAYVGRDVSVLVKGESARSVADMTGHSTCNKVVNFRGNAGLRGEIVTVRVTEAKAHSLYGAVAGAF